MITLLHYGNPRHTKSFAAFDIPDGFDLIKEWNAAMAEIESGSGDFGLDGFSEDERLRRAQFERWSGVPIENIDPYTDANDEWMFYAWLIHRGVKLVPFQRLGCDSFDGLKVIPCLNV